MFIRSAACSSRACHAVQGGPIHQPCCSQH
jgi:hypothetical protein